MPRYLVSGQVTISVCTEVEASSGKEAIRKAQDHGMMSLCHSCSSGEPTEEWVTSGELDGEVVEIYVEELD
jgi:hypothetical protein